MSRYSIKAAFLILLTPSALTWAGDGEPTLAATFAEVAPVIDGRLDDAVWKIAPVGSHFIAMLPKEDVPPIHDTQVQVAWDRGNLYVAAFLEDDEPELITRRLHRRDQESESDWLTVMIDGYHDHRTGRFFGVNAGGVQADGTISGDNSQDFNWSTVWESAVQVTDNGWVVEMRIPMTALRYNKQATAEWGFQVARYTSRHKELSWWARESQTDTRLVSRFGHLTGVNTSDPPPRFSLAPYGVVSEAAYSGDWASEAGVIDTETGLRAGADLQYGITSNITLDATLNPDFGQVELDPAQLNLSAFETFLPENRPFFLEGADIFQAVGSFGDDGEEQGTRFYYSRRIGQEGDILSAAKLTGRTDGGMSLGLIEAVTGVVEVQQDVAEDLEVGTEPVSANYAAARVKREVGSQSFVGAEVTAVNRADDPWYEASRETRQMVDEQGVLPDASMEPDQVADAYVGAIDGMARTADGEWGISGVVAASHRELPAGPTEAEGTLVQQGTMARVLLGRDTGTHVVGAASYSYATSDFNVNDLGYMNRVGEHGGWTWVQLRKVDGFGPLRSARLNTNTWYGHLLEYDERSNLGANFNVNLNTTSYAWGYVGAGVDASAFDPYEARMEGQLYHRPQSVFTFAGFGTDSRKPVQFHINLNAGASTLDEQNLSVSPGVSARIGDQGEMGLYANYRRSENEWGWATEACDIDGTCQPVFGRRDVSLYGLTSEGMYTFTRDLSLQYFAQLLMYDVPYYEYRGLDDQGALTELAIPFETDASTSGELFNFKSVLRWEYRPGSQIFLVWTHERYNGVDGFEDLAFSDHVGRTFSNGSINTVLLKASYRWGSEDPDHFAPLVHFRNRANNDAAIVPTSTSAL